MAIVPSLVELSWRGALGGDRKEEAPAVMELGGGARLE
jgi:hypothetical protein